jgi:hypothetical protein
MTTDGRTPSRDLLRLVWLGLALFVASLVSNAIVDPENTGDPAASYGHAAAALLPIVPGLLVLLAAGVIGLRRHARATGAWAASALLAIGAVDVLAGVIAAFAIDVAGPDREPYGGLLGAGMGALVVGGVWLCVLGRAARRHTPAGTRGGGIYVAYFAVLSLIGLIAWVWEPGPVNTVALVIVLAGIAVWLVARVRALRNRPAPSSDAGAADGLHPERPGDPGTHHGLAPAGEGKVRRSWRLTRTAWEVLRHDRTMLALAAISALLIGAATIALLWFAGYDTDQPGSDRFLWVFALATWPLTFVGTFFNVALAAAAAARFDGRRLSMGEALAVPARRVGQVAMFSLLAAGVGVVLQMIADRLPWGGRVVSWVIGAAWGLVTFFAVPILALEGCTAIGCVRRSTDLMKERWGEGVAGSITIGAWGVFLSLPAGVLIGIGIGVAGPVGIALVAAGILALVALTACTGAVRQVFSVALYRFAVDGQVSGGFAQRDLEAPFSGKRRWLPPSGG